MTMTVTETLDTYLGHWNRAAQQGRNLVSVSKTSLIDIRLGATGNSPTVHVGYEHAIKQGSAQDRVSDALYEALHDEFKRRCVDPTHRRASRRRQTAGPRRIDPCEKSHDWQLPEPNDPLYRGLDSWLREISGIVNLMKIEPGVGGITRATGPDLMIHIALRHDPTRLAVAV